MCLIRGIFTKTYSQLDDDTIKSYLSGEISAACFLHVSDSSLCDSKLENLVSLTVQFVIVTEQ